MQIYLDALRRLDWLSLLLTALVLLAATHPHAALAAAAGGGSLPWDAPLTTLKNDITGPVAFTISWNDEKYIARNCAFASAGLVANRADSSD